MSDAGLRPAQLDWSQGQPASTFYGDVYFSRDGGAAECRHVFLDGNQLPQTLAALAPEASLTIIETGFGSGLNWLCTQALRRELGYRGWLHYVSIEKHPLTVTDLRQAQACWPALTEFAQALEADYPELLPGFHRLLFPQWKTTLTLVFADVADALPHLCARADAWFLDGFAPARNPDMWTQALYAQMARLSRPGARFATFTAAGHVRRGLQAAGFAVTKRAGFGRKREMLCGQFMGVTPALQAPTAPPHRPGLERPALPAHARQARRALVIGAGIAGASTAHALALRGWQVEVLDAQHVAAGASGNPAAVVSLKPAPAGQALAHFGQHASLHMLRLLRQARTDLWQACGMLEWSAPGQERQRHRTAELPAHLQQTLDADAASQEAGLPLAQAARLQAQAGCLDAAAYCRQLLQHPQIQLREHCAVADLVHDQTVWQALDAQAQRIAQAPVLIVANGPAARALTPTRHLPLRAVRGQVALLPASAGSADLQRLLCERGYLSPALGGIYQGWHCAGASYVPDDEDCSLRAAENAEIRELLLAAVPALAARLSPVAQWRGRASLRAQSPDYLPLLGPVASPAQMQADYAGLRQGRVQDYPALSPLPGLYVHLGHGSQGFSQALLAAEILCAELCQEPAPVSQHCLQQLHPMRFYLRALKRGQC